MPDPVTDATLAAAARKAVLDKLLTAIRAGLDSGIGSHGHWDHTMRHGAGCELCIRQGAARRLMQEAVEEAAKMMEGGGS